MGNSFSPVDNVSLDSVGDFYNYVLCPSRLLYFGALQHDTFTASLVQPARATSTPDDAVYSIAFLREPS
jgi:hypothetical protein